MNGELDLFMAIGTFLGGLGLFMLGVSMITDGLKLAAGKSLRDILGRSTRTSLRGMVSGASLTAMVQSSSAVTIATIGFVNAGLLGTTAALSIVLGATIGTTMTGWLVAAVGFQFSITSFALPMVGLGMLARLIGPTRRFGAIGEAIAGFGLFFIGVDFLRGAFEGVAQSMDIADLAFEGIGGALVFAAIGLVMTMLTQSSSAAIAIILSAASGGLVSFTAAAAAMIGATVGTTSTSALAVIGATSSARRVAAGHVVINGFNAVVGLCLLPALVWLVTHHQERLLEPAVMLAIFHTSFNITGVMLMRPFIHRVSAFLERRFSSKAETLGRPQHLDRNVMVSPVLALDAFMLELNRMGVMAREHARAALSTEGEPGRALQLQHDGIRTLVGEVERFVGALESERLHRDVAMHLPMVLRISNYIDDAVTQAQEAAEHSADRSFLMQSPVRDRVLAYELALLDVIEQCDHKDENFDAAKLEHDYEALRDTWRKLKSLLLESSVRSQLSVQRLSPAIDNLRLMLRVVERLSRVALRSAELQQAVPAVVLEPDDQVAAAIEPAEEPASRDPEDGPAETPDDAGSVSGSDTQDTVR